MTPDCRNPSLMSNSSRVAVEFVTGLPPPKLCTSLTRPFKPLVFSATKGFLQDGSKKWPSISAKKLTLESRAGGKWLKLMIALTRIA